MFSRLTRLSTPISRVIVPNRNFSERLIKLNELTNIEGAVKKRKRWGRGIGSGRGKTSGHGHQFSRSTPRGFEGGQTPLYKRFPKIGFHNPNERDFQEVNLETVQEFIDQGRLKVPTNFFLTMRDLVHCGMLKDVKDGVKLLAKGKEKLRTPVHFEVSAASVEAIKAVEANGGTVTCSHFNSLALRSLIKPYKYHILPQRARPTPKLMQYYLNKDKSGYLAPEIQVRNLQLFGALNSEPRLREEHAAFMAVRRKQMAEERAKKNQTVAKA
eukprot:gene5175-5695_t